MRNIRSELLDSLQNITEKLAWWEDQGHLYQDLITKLEDLGYEANLSTTGLDIRGTGDKPKLVAAFRAFRAAGFKPTSRPDKKSTYFCCFFTHEDLKQVWFSFSSEVCHRVQIGTEMREVPLYDVVCTDGDMEVTEEEISNG